MKRRPPQLAPHRLAVALLLPLAGYLLAHALVGSSATALLIITCGPAVWLLGSWVARRRLEPVAAVTLATTILAVVTYALTHGDPLALELRRGAVTAPMGLAALTSVVLRRPLLLLLAQQRAQASPEVAARLADPQRRRFLSGLTAIVGLFLAADGLTQFVLALTVPTGSFVAASTMARVTVLGVGLIATVWYIRDRQQQLRRPPQRPVAPDRDR